FTTNKFGIQRSFYDPAPNEIERVRNEDGTMVVRGKGNEPHDASPLSFIVSDQPYVVKADIEVDDRARAGLLMFYNRRLYCGLGFDKDRFVMHRYGLERNARRHVAGRRLHLRITNDRHIVTIHYSADAKEWHKFDVQMEVSG